MTTNANVNASAAGSSSTASSSQQPPATKVAATANASTNVDASTDIDASNVDASTNAAAAPPPPTPKSIPDEYLHAVIAPLYTHACSTKTFRNVLSTIEHLSVLPPDARSVFLRELLRAAENLSTRVVKDLDKLVDVLNKVGGGGSDAVAAAADDSAADAKPMTPAASSTLNEVEVQKVTLALFTPSDSHQAKWLRVLKTIDFMCTGGQQQQRGDTLSINGAPATSSSSSSSSDAMQVETPSASQQSPPVTEPPVLAKFTAPSTYKEVWSRLQRCLDRVHEHSTYMFVATVLLPLIECFMIVSKYALGANNKDLSAVAADLTSSPAATLAQQQAQSPPTSSPHLTVFMQFTEKNKKILNSLIQSSPYLLSGSFSLLILNPKVLEFESKRLYFDQQLAGSRKHLPRYQRTINLSVRRQYIFQDSYSQLQNKTGDALKLAKLNVRFAEEEGADYGGVTREWYEELTKEMFNPNYALWQTSAEKTGITYQPSPSSWVNPSHLLYFRFIGRIIGKAIYDDRLLDCYFTRSVYKHILGKPVDLTDMEALDPEYHKSLVWILENSIDDVLDLTFSTEADEFGQQKTVDLVPDGRNVAVTDANKHDYVRLIVEHKLTTSVKEQLKAFLDGFFDIIPPRLVRIFNEKELELLVSGVPDIDIDDWKNNTEYRGYTSTSPQIQWFWRVVRSFDQEERAKLLQFATGTSKVPLDGFANLQGMGNKQRFQIHKDFGNTTRLPSAHTCFNQIDLPVYESYDQLRERLLKAITEGNTGFGFE